MATKAQLEDEFKTYFDEMDKCEAAGCYWALLHLVFMMPAFCAALEASNGQSTGPQYMAWCASYLAEPMLDDWERYGIRCALLHQGQTIPHDVKKHPPSRYPSVVYGRQGDPHLKTDLAGRLQLDVSALHTEMKGAVRDWFSAMLAAQPTPVLDSNLGKMAHMSLPRAPAPTQTAAVLPQGMVIQQDNKTY
jgi:hypothetical protein